MIGSASVTTKGLCDGHRRREIRSGNYKTDPLRARRKGPYTLIELLGWTVPAGECLKWSRGTNTQGYGIVQHDGVGWMAHRLSFHLSTGLDIGRQVVHHTCSNPWCIKPEHLQLAHQADNNLEMLARRSYVARIEYLEARVRELENELAAKAVIFG
jgi:hypothetical protein